MKILFSPSEDKNFIYDGNLNPRFTFLDDLLFGRELKASRLAFIEDYLDVLATAPSGEIARIFGAKNLSGKMGIDTLNACSNVDCANTIESIFLYSGVAFKALDAKSLPKKNIDFLFENVLIFSNLFGVIRASDKIPYYKLKQGEKFKNNDITKIYLDFKKHLDSYLQNSDVLDLRAEFYTKAYKLSFPHTKVEFYKNNKKSTHYSKHYRGLLLRHIALKGAFEVPFKLLNIKQDKYARILQYEV